MGGGARPFPDALAVPMRAVPGRLAGLPRAAPLVVLCRHGGRSLRVTYWLRAQGAADAVNLRGGIDAWSSEIDHLGAGRVTAAY